MARHNTHAECRTPRNGSERISARLCAPDRAPVREWTPAVATLSKRRSVRVLDPAVWDTYDGVSLLSLGVVQSRPGREKVLVCGSRSLTPAKATSSTASRTRT
jgi:hypothetical protein